MIRIVFEDHIDGTIGLEPLQRLVDLAVERVALLEGESIILGFGIEDVQDLELIGMGSDLSSCDGIIDDLAIDLLVEKI